VSSGDAAKEYLVCCIAVLSICLCISQTCSVLVCVYVIVCVCARKCVCPLHSHFTDTQKCTEAPSLIGTVITTITTWRGHIAASVSYYTPHS